MASFNHKLERGKALKGRDKKVWPQRRTRQSCRLPSLPWRGAERAAHPMLALGGFETFNLFCGEIPHGNTGKGAAKHWFVICYFLHRNKQLFLHAEIQEWGAKMRNVSGTTAFRDCFCRGYFVSYIQTSSKWGTTEREHCLTYRPPSC